MNYYGPAPHKREFDQVVAESLRLKTQEQIGIENCCRTDSWRCSFFNNDGTCTLWDKKIEYSYDGIPLSLDECREKEEIIVIKKSWWNRLTERIKCFFHKESDKYIPVYWHARERVCAANELLRSAKVLAPDHGCNSERSQRAENGGQS
jgi:hypothetical protein